MAQEGKRPGMTRRVFMRIGVLVVTAVTVLAHVLTDRFRTVLDGRFGRGEVSVTPLEGTEDWDSEYVKKETGSLAEAKEASDVTSEQVTDEGIVLLKNDGILPLAAGSRVVPFGYAYLNPSYSGNGAAASQDTTMVTPEAALSSYFEVNGASAEAMGAAEPTSPDAAEGTTALDFSYSSATSGEQMLEANRILAYDPSIFAQVEDSFGGSTGIVFVKRIGSEGYDRRTEGYDDGTPHNLALSLTERETVRYARETCGSVVLVLNSANPMELAPVMSGDYEANAIVWVGTTGSRGFESLAKILCGEVNPSGRLVDIYPADFTTDPTFVNFGYFEYTNATTEDDTMAPLNIGTYNRHFVEYEEGVYVGYRYYETEAVEDPSFVYGTLDGRGAFKEPGAVAYPFGYGLSYTTFSYDNLRIDRAETQFPDSVDTYADCVYEKAGELLQGMMEDGSLLCDLYGERLFDDQGPQAWIYTDTGILFPPDSEILSLTDDERRQIDEEYKRNEMSPAELEAERVAQQEKEMLTQTDFSEIDPGFFVKI